MEEAMESKERIINNFQFTTIGGDTSYPQYSHHHDEIKNPDESFKNVLEDVGGECFFVNSFAEFKDSLATLDIYKSAKNICSCVDEVDKGNVDINSVEKIHDLRNVDLAIVRGEFGVGENAAVWVNADSLKHRGVLFLSENIILIIDSGKIVSDMESAYKLIDFNKLKSGYFISGPSKTADIEQCLVIGAHGAKSLIVFIIRP
jgi:L-lactate dehydrogenase complex protein LldG